MRSFEMPDGYLWKRLSGNMKRLLNRLLDRLRLGAFARDSINRIRYLMDPGLVMRNMRFRRGLAPDGLPLYSPGMAYLVSGQFDVLELYGNGLKGAAWISDLLAGNSVPFAGRVLASDAAAEGCSGSGRTDPERPSCTAPIIIPG